jgi:hypothetical protein
MAAGSTLPWEHEKDSDPQKIPAKAPNKPGPPTLKGPANPSAEERARLAALAATGKFDNEAEDGESNGGPSLPDDFQDASVSGSSPALDKNHCEKMVEILQLLIDTKLKDLGGSGRMVDHAALNLLVERIDYSFQNAFVGGMTSFSSAGTTGPPPAYFGQTGFKPEFQEKDASGNVKNNEDQTHHFAAFFHVGVTGQSWKAWAHDNLWEDSQADFELGPVAYALGASLNQKQLGTQSRINRTNPRYPIPETIPVYEGVAPRLQRIVGIADAVKGKICN